MSFIKPNRLGAYAVTPIGAPITQDESNVGRQLLKKMGWTPETGLGKDRNGITEPIRASCNFGRKGLGKSPLQSSGMPQQSAFDAILKSLSNKASASNKEAKTDLEDKSKKSISRLHYGKFVRAKDVSKYSKQSLKIVLGASVDETEKSDLGVSSAPINCTSEDAGIKNEFGVKTYSSSTDLATYFRMKREALNLSGSKHSPKRSRQTPTSEDGEPASSLSGNRFAQLGIPTTSISDENPKAVTERRECLMSLECRVVSSSEPDDTGVESETGTNRKPGEVEPTRSGAFVSSNLHSLLGYPFY